jgi:hypothetical protein
MGCGCIDEIDRRLSAFNTRLVLGFSLTEGAVGPFGAGQWWAAIATTKVDPRRRGRAMQVVPIYCPFCGLRYRPADPAPVEAPAAEIRGPI